MNHIALKDWLWKRSNRKKKREVTKMVDAHESKEEIEYLNTGIKGFDELIGKGIPKGSQILISGGPGTLKTTFCMQTLANSAKKDRRGLYLSFEESEKNLTRNMSAYGWDINISFPLT